MAPLSQWGFSSTRTDSEVCAPVSDHAAGRALSTGSVARSRGCGRWRLTGRRLSSQAEESCLDDFVIDSLRQQDTAAELGCDNPDFILALETPGQMAMRAVYALEAVQFDF